tara:strand:+ start:14774 stop:15763 length:990 start_codon:yes stop_codon:yes gene_type:complete
MNYEVELLKIRKLFFQRNYDLKNLDITKIEGGKNNLAFKVEADNKKYFAKFYLSNKHLNAELKFLQYLQTIKIDNTPNPVFVSQKDNLAIHEFIDGKPFQKKYLKKDVIMEAAQFLHKINKKKIGKINIENASESSFDLQGHFRIIDKRIFLLKNIDHSDSLNIEVINLIKELLSYWEEVKNNILSLKSNNQFQELKKEDICISPSDFGFHNCIVGSNNKTYFIDFEYAGFDDPAKTLSDFFIQPEIEVPKKFLEEFGLIAFKDCPNKLDTIERTKILFPMFQVKWVCIVLNEFLEDKLARRIFSHSIQDISEHKIKQLNKAKKIFSEI